ncbi:hypothetical protein BCU12_21850 [Vibrio sp. 10N.261.55.A7]|nr:hypothetical protein BCU12_21850 [Vibrio sp. 10N.261.55.A7]
MNNPKVFLLSLVLASFVLFVLVKLKDHSTSDTSGNDTFKGVVMSNTLTQSIDGHRRFLTVSIDGKEPIILTISPAVNCEIGRFAIISPTNTLLSEKKQYKYVSCQ